MYILCCFFIAIYAYFVELLLGLLLRSVCVGLSISLAPLWMRVCVSVFGCFYWCGCLGVDFDICFVWLILHTAHPTMVSIAAYFYHLFSQVSVFIVWTLCVALQWLLNGRSCLVSPSPPIQFILFLLMLPPLLNTLCVCVFFSLCYSDFIAAYFTANKISTP